MGIDLIWWRDRPILELLCHGTVEGVQFVTKTRESLEHPRYPALVGQLVDLRQADSLAINRDQIRTIVELDLQGSEKAPDCEKVALVAPEDLIFGYARMYELTLEGRIPGWEVGVFRTRPEALAWLGVEDRPDAPAG